MKRTAAIVTLTLAAFAAAQAANLLLNSSFEDDVGSGNWATSWGGFTRENWPNNVPNGSYAGYIRGTWSQAGDKGGIIQSVTAKGGASYSLSGYFYFDNNWKATEQLMKLEFFGDGDKLLAAFTNNLSDLTDKTWKQETITATAPANATRAQVVVEVNGAGAEGILGFDKLELAEAGQ